MTRMTVWMITAAFAATAATAGAQDRPTATGTLLKLQVVMTKYDGDKKVSSLPYTMFINATDPDDKVSYKEMTMGVEVPLTVQIKEVPTVVFKDVGSSIKGTATTVAPGRYRLVLSVEQSYVATEASSASRQNGVTAGPLLRVFRETLDLVMRDGQTSQTSSAADPVSGEVLKIDLALSLVK